MDKSVKGGKYPQQSVVVGHKHAVELVCVCNGQLTHCCLSGFSQTPQRGVKRLGFRGDLRLHASCSGYSDPQATFPVDVA
jgi:hypothetical protein